MVFKAKARPERVVLFFFPVCGIAVALLIPLCYARQRELMNLFLERRESLCQSRLGTECVESESITDEGNFAVSGNLN